jgi:hypothetical protein
LIRIYCAANIVSLQGIATEFCTILGNPNKINHGNLRNIRISLFASKAYSEICPTNSPLMLTLPTSLGIDSSAKTCTPKFMRRRPLPNAGGGLGRG